MSRIC